MKKTIFFALIIIAIASCKSVPEDQQIQDYLKKKNTCLLVRRVPGISETMRERIAKAAVKHRRGKYFFKTIMREKWPHFMSRMRDPEIDEETQRGLVCSTLCARAVAIGTDTVSLLPADRGLVTPATLSASTKLEDVSMRWCRVA